MKAHDGSGIAAPHIKHRAEKENANANEALSTEMPASCRSVVVAQLTGFCRTLATGQKSMILTM